MLNKTITVAAALLFLVAGTVSAQPPDMNRPPAPPGMGWGKFQSNDDAMPFAGAHCMKGIELTADQREQLVKLQREHHRSRIEQKSEMAGMHEKVKLMVTDDKFSKADAEKYAKQIGEFHRKQVETKILHMRQIRDLLTDEQKVVFDANVLSMGGFGGGPGKCKEFRHRRGHGRGMGRGPHAW